MSGFDTHQYGLLNNKPESSDKQAWKIQSATGEVFISPINPISSFPLFGG